MEPCFIISCDELNVCFCINLLVKKDLFERISTPVIYYTRNPYSQIPTFFQLMGIFVLCNFVVILIKNEPKIWIYLCWYLRNILVKAVTWLFLMYTNIRSVNASTMENSFFIQKCIGKYSSTS